MKGFSCVAILAAAVLASSCGGSTESASVGSSSSPVSTQKGPLGPPLSDFSSCRVEVVDVPSTIGAGSAPFKVKVTVMNASTTTWPAATARSLDHAVNIGYHFDGNKDGQRTWLVEGGRVLLPHNLATGSSVSLDLIVTPPAQAGAYFLVVEPVQEGVTWFSNKGGCVFSVPITVS